MISMDVKGITWVGGVYQKFETMCLEVEEDMYQDTVKFVENQVQTVGASVKKFYADVMQDLVCDSAVDPEAMPANGDPVENNFHVDSSKKSKVSKKGELVKVDVEKVNGDSEVIAALNMDVDHKSLFHGQHMDEYGMLSSGNCARGACSDVYSRQDHDGSSFNNSNSVVKENPIKDRFPGAITPVESDLSRHSTSCLVNLDDTHEVSSDHRDTAITPSITEGGLHESNFHATESNTVVHGTETIQRSERAKLEETCVMVTGKDVCFVPHMEGKRRPYKKKIQNALRMRSARKQEYEQLALWYGDDAKSNLKAGERLRHSLTVEETQKSPAHEFCESEWEIL